MTTTARGIAAACTWCGHPKHPQQQCAHQIQTTPRDTAPCPCNHHRKENKK